MESNHLLLLVSFKTNNKMPPLRAIFVDLSIFISTRLLKFFFCGG